MKISAILTVASLCLAGLIEASPVDGNAVSRFFIVDEDGKNHFDFEEFFSAIDDIDEKSKEKGVSPIEDRGEFIGQIEKEIPNYLSIDELVDEVEWFFQSEEDLEEIVSHENSETMTPPENEQIGGVPIEARDEDKKLKDKTTDRIGKIVEGLVTWWDENQSDDENDEGKKSGKNGKDKKKSGKNGKDKKKSGGKKRKGKKPIKKVGGPKIRKP